MCSAKHLVQNRMSQLWMHSCFTLLDIKVPKFPNWKSVPVLPINLLLFSWSEDECLCRVESNSYSLKVTVVIKSYLLRSCDKECPMTFLHLIINRKFWQMTAFTLLQVTTLASLQWKNHSYPFLLKHTKLQALIYKSLSGFLWSNFL